MKQVYLIIIAVFISFNLMAQYPGAGGNRGGSQNMNVGHFYGKVVDESTGKPIENASVQLSQNKMDPVLK